MINLSALGENKCYVKKRIKLNQDDIKYFMKSFDDPTEYFNIEQNIKLSI